MPSSYTFLRRLFVEGGAEIVTPNVARTLIQPDADIVHFVQEDVVLACDADRQLDAHFAEIDVYLKSLKRVRFAYRYPCWALTSGFSIWGLAQAYQAYQAQLWWGLLYTPLGLLLGLLPLLARRGVVWFFRRKVRLV